VDANVTITISRNGTDPDGSGNEGALVSLSGGTGFLAFPGSSSPLEMKVVSASM
jgi:hypothetical protein